MPSISMWLSVWHAQCCLNVKTWLLQREQHYQSEQLQSVSCEKKVKDCSEGHTCSRFSFPGLPTSCIDFKRALQWFIWHLYKGSQSTEGPHRQGLQRSSELYLCWETKTRETATELLLLTFALFHWASRLSFLPCRSDPCHVATKALWRLKRQNCGSSLRYVPFWDT